MGRPRWPAVAPPVSGGVEVHGRRLLAADAHLTLDVIRIVSFESGLAVHLALTATGAPAEGARRQTRPLTDPDDWSAEWSYLTVWAAAENTDAEADPYLPRPDVHACDAGLSVYRTEPRYWLGTPPTVRSVTLTAEWPQIGLPATTAILALEPTDQPSIGNRSR
ncbi:serine/threonine protein kinase [Rhodococcus sp. IEGM 248]|nr:serine/threonine protein kinase [Rhodococcus sp. IEGM 248]